MAKEFRVYKPKNDGNGTAIAWQLSYKEANKYNPWTMFLVAAKQVGQDNNGNAKFDWENGFTVKLGDADLGEIIALLEGRKRFLGSKGSLFHQTPSGGNKVISIEPNDYGYIVSVSAQDENKTNLGKISNSMTHGEASLLLVLLKKAVENIYGW